MSKTPVNALKKKARHRKRRASSSIVTTDEEEDQDDDDDDDDDDDEDDEDGYNDGTTRERAIIVDVPEKDKIWTKTSAGRNARMILDILESRPEKKSNEAALRDVGIFKIVFYLPDVFLFYLFIQIQAWKNGGKVDLRKLKVMVLNSKNVVEEQTCPVDKFIWAAQMVSHTISFFAKKLIL